MEDLCLKVKSWGFPTDFITQKAIETVLKYNLFLKYNTDHFFTNLFLFHLLLVLTFEFCQLNFILNLKYVGKTKTCLCCQKKVLP